MCKGAQGHLGQTNKTAEPSGNRVPGTLPFVLRLGEVFWRLSAIACHFLPRLRYTTVVRRSLGLLRGPLARYAAHCTTLGATIQARNGASLLTPTFCLPSACWRTPTVPCSAPVQRHKKAHTPDGVCVTVRNPPRWLILKRSAQALRLLVTSYAGPRWARGGWPGRRGKCRPPGPPPRRSSAPRQPPACRGSGRAQCPGL